jgi:hypothetical protein
MGLEFAIDALYESGWSPEGDGEVVVHGDGRAYPSSTLVRAAFRDAGFELSVRHIQLFDCYRAEWSDSSGQAGAVVGQSAEEAAVYALSQLRRQLAKQYEGANAV